MEDCSICLISMDENNSYKVSCNHIFHKACLGTWLENNSTCPCCRNEIPMDLNTFPDYINNKNPFQSDIFSNFCLNLTELDVNEPIIFTSRIFNPIPMIFDRDGIYFIINDLSGLLGKFIPHDFIRIEIELNKYFSRYNTNPDNDTIIEIIKLALKSQSIRLGLIECECYCCSKVTKNYIVDKYGNYYSPECYSKNKNILFQTDNPNYIMNHLHIFLFHESYETSYLNNRLLMILKNIPNIENFFSEIYDNEIEEIETYKNLWREKIYNLRNFPVDNMIILLSKYSGYTISYIYEQLDEYRHTRKNVNFDNLKNVVNSALN